MPPPRSQQLYEWIVARVSVQSSSRRIYNWIKDALDDIAVDLPELERLNLIPRRMVTIREMLIREQVRAVAEGVPVFEVIGEPPEFLRGFGLPLPGDDIGLVQRRRRAILQEPVWNALRELSPPRFEAVWRILVGHLGGSNFNLRGRSGDEGIDFTAEFNVYQLTVALSAIATEWLETTHIRSTITVIGQAKHWPNRTVQPENLRELLGTITLHTPNIPKGERKGVLGMLVTTGHFSKYADAQARRAGLILLDGEWVISAIINFGIGVTETEGTQSFNGDTFVALIDESVVDVISA